MSNNHFDLIYGELFDSLGQLRDINQDQASSIADGAKTDIKTDLLVEENDKDRLTKKRNHQAKDQGLHKQVPELTEKNKRKLKTIRKAAGEEW